MRKLLGLCLTGFIFFSIAPAYGGAVTYTFNDGTADGLILTNFPNNNNGFSTSFAGGTVNQSETAGSGNGYTNLATPFNVSGDFTATVNATRTAGIGNSELVFSLGNLTNGQNAIADVYYRDTTRIDSNIFLPTMTGVETSNAATSVLFEIQRTGNTITTYYDSGSGPVQVFSKTDPTLTAAAPINLQLLEEFGDTGTHTAVSFDNLTITGPSVPEPSTLAFFGALGLLRLNRSQRPAFNPRHRDRHTKPSRCHDNQNNAQFPSA